MHRAFAEGVTISAERPVIDDSTPEVEAKVPSSFFLSRMTERNYVSAVQAPPETRRRAWGRMPTGAVGSRRHS